MIQEINDVELETTTWVSGADERCCGDGRPVGSAKDTVRDETGIRIGVGGRESDAAEVERGS